MCELRASIGLHDDQGDVVGLRCRLPKSRNPLYDMVTQLLGRRRPGRRHRHMQTIQPKEVAGRVQCIGHTIRVEHYSVAREQRASLSTRCTP